MEKTHRVLRILIAFVILMVLPLLAYAEELKVVKIGFLMPMTGPVGVYGTMVQQGAALAIDHLNEDGGFLVNGQRYTIVLETFDDRFDPKLALTGATMMVKDGIKMIIGPCNAAACMAVYEVTWPERVVQLNFSSELVIKNTPFPNNLFLCDGPEERRNYHAEYYAKGLGAKTIGWITSNVQFQLDLQRLFSEACAKKGIKTVINQVVEMGTEDFYDAIAKIRKANPDIVFVDLVSGDCPTFVRQRMELNYPVQLVSIDTIAGGGAPGFRAMGAAAAKGIIEPMFFLNPEHQFKDWELETMGFNSEQLRRFLTGIIAKHGIDYFSPYQACGYAYITLFVDAMQRAGTVGYKGTAKDGEKLIAAMESTNLKTAKGSFRFYPDAHYNLEGRLWVRHHVVNEKTGEFAMDTLAAAKAIDHKGNEWELYIDKKVNINDIRAGRDPDSANYGHPY